jgi:two-component system, LytTR family, response regulator
MVYQIAIVEDDLHQQQNLKELLQLFPEFNLAGTAFSIGEAEQLLKSTKPDLVFLDVELPPHTSFELLANLGHLSFHVIFTTAYEKYAVQAFRFSALDYLLKPLTREDLANSLEKFKKRVLTDEQANLKNLLANLHLSSMNQRIALPTLNGFLYVAVKDIMRCESDNTYTTFHTVDNKKIVVSRTLKETEQMLHDFPSFFRVHNSHLINLDYMVEYIKGEGGIVRMKDNSEVDVSRRRKEEFLRHLKKH